MNQNLKSITTFLPCAGLLCIQNKRLLLAFSRTKQCFYLPGGKIGPTESAVQALCRECLEELCVELRENDLQYFTHITAPAYGEKEGTVMEQDCYILYKPISPTASSEIETLRYFSLDEYQAEASRAPGVIMIMKQLKKEGYIH